MHQDPAVLVAGAALFAEVGRIPPAPLGARVRRSRRAGERRDR